MSKVSDIVVCTRTCDLTVYVSLCVCVCLYICLHTLCVAHRAQTFHSSLSECQVYLSRLGRSILIMQREKEQEYRRIILSLTLTKGHCREDPPFWPRSRWSLPRRSPRRRMASCDQLKLPFVTHTHIHDSHSSLTLTHVCP